VWAFTFVVLALSAVSFFSFDSFFEKLRLIPYIPAIEDNTLTFSFTIMDPVLEACSTISLERG